MVVVGAARRKGETVECTGLGCEQMQMVRERGELTNLE